MSLGLWVTLGGIGVSAATAFVIAYMHRRQMRQIELYKKYPGMPLTPPHHPITIWMIDYGLFYLLYGLAYGIQLALIVVNAWIVHGERKKTPLTPNDVLNINKHEMLILVGFVWTEFLFIIDLMRVRIDKALKSVRTDTRK